MKLNCSISYIRTLGDWESEEAPAIVPCASKVSVSPCWVVDMPLAGVGVRKLREVD